MAVGVVAMHTSIGVGIVGGRGGGGGGGGGGAWPPN